MRAVTELPAQSTNRSATSPLGAGRTVHQSGRGRSSPSGCSRDDPSARRAAPSNPHEPCAVERHANRRGVHGAERDAHRGDGDDERAERSEHEAEPEHHGHRASTHLFQRKVTMSAVRSWTPIAHAASETATSVSNSSFVIATTSIVSPRTHERAHRRRASTNSRAKYDDRSRSETHDRRGSGTNRSAHRRAVPEPDRSRH